MPLDLLGSGQAVKSATKHGPRTRATLARAARVMNKAAVLPISVDASSIHANPLSARHRIIPRTWQQSKLCSSIQYARLFVGNPWNGLTQA
eukprot:6468049-Amphidinium_carterae.1